MKWEFQWLNNRVALRPLFPSRICWFFRGRKTGIPGEIPSERGREPTPNSPHMA